MLTIKWVRRIIATVVGGTLILIGTALLFLPGPGTVVMLAGLGVLATEFVWARRWLRRIKAKAGEVAGNLKSTS